MNEPFMERHRWLNPENRVFWRTNKRQKYCSKMLSPVWAFLRAKKDAEGLNNAEMEQFNK